MKNRKLVRTIYNITYAGEVLETQEEGNLLLKVHPESEFFISIPLDEIKEII